MTEHDPFADWPDRTPLFDEDDRLILVFTASSDTRDGRPWADGVWRPPDVPVSQAAELALDTFTSCALSTSDTDLVGALMDAGATRLRHAHVMSHDLRRLPALAAPTDVRLESLTADVLDDLAEPLGAIRFAAYPTDHPDHSHETADEAVAAMRSAARGEVLGRLMDDVSRVAVFDGQPVGACLVVDREGVPPDGGPWILDVFRDPGSPAIGVGRWLLGAVLSAARAAALPGVSLAVSHDNVRARRLYASLGFVDAGESWTVGVP